MVTISHIVVLHTTQISNYSYDSGTINNTQNETMVQLIESCFMI